MSEDSNPFGLESADWELVKPSERDTSNLLAAAACGYFLSWFLGELERKSEKDTDYEWIIKVHISELSSLVNKNYA